ncbi:MbeD/MobD family mobilization/exclusion protein [Klebsiella quasipneumoniae]|uniref:MbeD/MobD family mobilization/exclusion protein n=1 Tax=Klebsiella quasipneumoniae TaxID=1463165 RepID=UPI00388FCB9E
MVNLRYKSCPETAGQDQDEWESAFAEWQKMSGLMQRENAALNERVTAFRTQMQSLSEQRSIIKR